MGSVRKLGNQDGLADIDRLAIQRSGSEALAGIGDFQIVFVARGKEDALLGFLV